MNRRNFLLTTAAIAVAGPVFAAPMDYTPGLVDDLLAEGKTVFVDFTTTWCTTCNAQKNVMASLKAANPAYEENIAFVTVDFDDYRKDPLTIGLNIPRRSTLVVLHGDQELGRTVAGSSTAVIQDLMDTALNAATTS